jgi:serine/threonine protein phosphatase PrpC
MLTVAHRVENGGKGEDRLLVERYGARTLAIVADGAGGIGGGAAAAEMACSLMAQSMRTTIVGTPELLAKCLFDVDQALARQGSGGQCTAVVVEISENRVSGASVGDSGAWMITSREILDLTERQQRKPLLGSGEASPVGFGPVQLSGRLLLASDGLFKYATRCDIRERALVALSVGIAVETLVEGLRLRSGAFQDDVAIILVECVV